MRTLIAIAQEVSVSLSGVWSPFVLANCLYDHLVDSSLCTNQPSHKILCVYVNLWYYILIKYLEMNTCVIIYITGKQWNKITVRCEFSCSYDHFGYTTLVFGPSTSFLDLS